MLLASDRECATRGAHAHREWPSPAPDCQRGTWLGCYGWRPAPCCSCKQLQAHVERGPSWLAQIGDSRSEISPRHLHCARRPARRLRLPQAHSRDVSGNASPERRSEHQQVPAKLDPAIDGMCSAMSVAVDCSQSTSLSPVRPELGLDHRGDHLECAVRRRIWAKPRRIELVATDRC